MDSSAKFFTPNASSLLLNSKLVAGIQKQYATEEGLRHDAWKMGKLFTWRELVFDIFSSCQIVNFEWLLCLEISMGSSLFKVFSLFAFLS